MSIASTYPEHGARFQMKRTALDETAAHYAVDVYRPGLRAEFAMRIGRESGAIDISAGPLHPLDETPATAVPEWVEKHLAKLGKQLAKAATWPRRFDRWRADPD